MAERLREENDSVTMAEFLKERGASHGAIELLEYPYASAEDDPVSLLWNLRDVWYPLHEITRYKIDGGNDKLPRALAEKLNREDLLRFARGAHRTGLQSRSRDRGSVWNTPDL
jgi:hypothetical protein